MKKLFFKVIQKDTILTRLETTKLCENYVQKKQNI